MTKEYVKNYPTQIAEINEHLSKIAEIVNSLPQEASFTKSLQTSVINFQKKVDGFLAVSAKITDKQRAAIAAIKAGKSAEEVSEILTAPDNSDEGSTGSNDEKPSKKTAKSKR